MKTVILKTVMLMTLLLGNIAVAEIRGEEALRRSDEFVRMESEALQSLYWEGMRHWQAGNPVQALRDLDYAAWQGSVAAAQRLCVMDAYGIGTEPNFLKADFWCERAAEAGQNVAEVRNYLQNYRLATK